VNNLLTITRRELRAYYESAIGYIFVIVFLLVAVGLFMSSFFTFPRAEMRQFFSLLPIIMCVFVPAVTMRLWAEERKENTWEMLLTLPMQSWELVGGKFLAALIFFGVALAGTFTVPVMLFFLGSPDPGPILGAYFGTVLLGAFFLAMGIFFSALVADQIVAFVLALLACFGVFLLGTEFIMTILDGTIPGLGSLLSELVGMTGHYNDFGKGVIEIGDVLYFLVWTAVFLYLNVLYLEGRNRAGHHKTYATAVALCVGIGLAFNWIVADQSIARFDLTQDQIYTVSEATQRILSKLKVPVQVKFYVTPKDKMPTGMKNLEQDVLDKLEEMDKASNGFIDFKAIHMEAANVIAGMRDEQDEDKKDEKDEAIEKRMLDKGVQPFSVQALEEDQVTSKLVYSSIGVAYKESQEEILPQIMPQNIDELEYRLVNLIYKMTLDEKPKVAMLAPMQDVDINPQLAQMLMQMGRPVPRTEDPYQMLQRVLESEKYDVDRIKLSARERLPEKTSTIVVVNPKELDDRQKWEIARALHEGVNVVMAVQQNEWNYEVKRNTVSISRRDVKPGVNDILKEFGLEVSDDILMDSNHQALTLQDPSNPLASLLGGGLTLNLPHQVVVSQANMNREVSITDQISDLFYLWGSALKVNDEKLKELKLKKTVLFSSSDDAWTVPASHELTQSAFDKPSTGLKRYPLAIMVEGQFPLGYAGKDRPEFPKEPQQQPMMGYQPPAPEDKPYGPPTAKPGKLILVGCSQFFRKNFLGQGALDFFMNCVDGVTLGDDIIQVRGQKRIDRTIKKPSDTARAFWKFVNFGLINLIVAAVGIVGAILRRQAREAYTMSHQA